MAKKKIDGTAGEIGRITQPKAGRIARPKTGRITRSKIGRITSGQPKEEGSTEPEPQPVVTTILMSNVKPSDHEKALQGHGRNPRGVGRSKLGRP